MAAVGAFKYPKANSRNGNKEEPAYQNFDYSAKIYFAQYQISFKNCVDNPVNHNDEKKPHQYLFYYSNGMNTISCILQYYFLHHLAQAGHKLAPRSML